MPKCMQPNFEACATAVRRTGMRQTFIDHMSYRSDSIGRALQQCVAEPLNQTWVLCSSILSLDQPCLDRPTWVIEFVIQGLATSNPPSAEYSKTTRWQEDSLLMFGPIVSTIRFID
jgi:hypothetical protein